MITFLTIPKPIISEALNLHKTVKGSLRNSDQTTLPASLNLAAPASAALDVLGMSASKVSVPANLQELSAGLIQGFDNAGKLKQGFSYSFTPKLFGPAKQSVSKYFGDWDRVKNSTVFSLSALKGGDGDPSARAAIGLSFPFIDRSDWRADKKLREEANTAYNRYLDSFALETITKPDNWNDSVANLRNLLLRNAQKLKEGAKTRAQVEEAIEAIEKWNSNKTPETETLRDAALAVLLSDDWADLADGELSTPSFETQIDKLIKPYADKSWNRRRLALSVATTWFAADSASNGLQTDGTYAWLSYADTFGADGQLTFFGRYANKDRSFDSATKAWVTGDVFSFGFRYKYGNSKAGFFAEFLQTDRRLNPTTLNRETITQGGYEVALSDSQWLQIAFGGGSGDGITRNIFGINWTFNLSPSRSIKLKND